MFIMIAGIGIIGALASILASVLVGGQDEAEPAPTSSPSDSDMAAIRTELADMRLLLEQMQPPTNASE